MVAKVVENIIYEPPLLSRLEMWIVDKIMCNAFSNSVFHLELVYSLILVFTPGYLFFYYDLDAPLKRAFWPIATVT